MVILSIIAVIVLFFFYIRKPKRLQKVMPILRRIWEWLVPFEWEQKQLGLTKSVIKALNDTSSISRMLLLHSYEHKAEGYGIYNLSTGRRAIGFKITPPPFVTENVINLVKSTLKTITVKDTAVQIMTYASNDISEYLDGIETSCQCDTNVSSISSLKTMRDDRIQKLKKWANDTMLSNGADFRARNLISMVIFIFPKDTSIPTIKTAYKQIEGILTDLNPEALSPKLVASIYGEILKEDSSLSDYDIHQRMNTQLAKGAHIRINANNSLIEIGKKTYAKVLTTNKYPVHTFPINVQDAFFPIDGEYQNPLPCRFLTSLTIHMENPEKLKERILKRARANVKNEAKMPAGTATMFPKTQKTIDESKEIIQYIEEDNESIYEGMYSLTIFENSEEKLDQAIGRIKTKFSGIDFGGWDIGEEDFGIIALQILLWSLPFQFDNETKRWLNRYNLMFSSNISAIVPLIGSFKGIGSPILRFFSRSGQVVGLDLWRSDSNYNACIIGPSGTGKSFLSNSIQASNAQAGVRSIIFDIGRSYLPLCNEIGGEFTHFADTNPDGTPNKKCLNFFTNIVTTKTPADSFQGESITVGYETFPLMELTKDGMVESIHEDSFSSILIIVGAMCGVDLSIKNNMDNTERTAQIASLLESAIRVAFFRRKREAGMRDVGEALKNFMREAEVRRHNDIVLLLQDMVIALEPYIAEGGKFYSYYNGAYNINVKNDFFVVELEELTQKGVLYYIVFMSMLERAAQEMYFTEGKRKSVVIDEAAPILGSTMFAKYLDDFARRIRKYNGSLTIITQNPEDFLANSNSKAIWSNTTHKFILELNTAKVEKNFAKDGLFYGYSEFTKRQMASVKNRAPQYSELLYIYADKLSEVLLLKATPQEAAMFTTNPEEKNMKRAFQKEYGLTPQESTRMLGYTKEGLEIKEILQRLKEGDRSYTTKYWVEKIRTAINKDLIIPQSQLVLDENKDPVFYETYLCIQDEATKELYTLKDFGEVAREQDLMPLLNKKFIEKAVEFYRPRETMFSFNISMEDISLQYCDMLKDIADNFAPYIFLEIPAGVLSEKGTRKKTMEFCKKAKEYGFMITIDHLTLENFSLGFIKEISPELIKIDGELILAIQNNEEKIKELEVFPIIAKALGFKVAAVHVENEELFEVAQRLGFEFYQGHYINVPTTMIDNLILEEAE
ncbi:hypothetical protein CQA49_00855 [Helicobacter sp. MIT 00-7814]|uniref:TraG/VirB4 family ATPase n=1 Tax=unclassified Helicobacter TaxID=2593540 RepID=UPI000E1F78F1|nr:MULTISPECIES: EAL domain-containing protein [unclassified Helicobacter]RDU55062.1 hypothetical protein CQA37_04445 [Helicobacter sp. MIT 99-10781]RDU56881.1 hypothetical protein CQA49_00855 [Helicobacter sp. MIT 00-7814]